MERFLKTRFVLIICLTFGLGFALSSVVKAQEGCSPGYWKQQQHFDSWVNAEPIDTFFSVFGRTITIRLKIKDGGPTKTDPTLLEALKAQGGGINALARQAVAALLNAENGDVESPGTAMAVITLFQMAFDGDIDRETLKNGFEDANESGCPLNGDAV